MNNLMKLGLAIVIAVMAGGLNWAYLASKEVPTNYLALRNGIKAGDPFPSTDDFYKKIAIPNDPPENKLTLIPVKERAIVFGMRARRDFQDGEPIFFSDIAQDVPRFETLGPFTLLSVGEHLTGPVETEQSDSGGGEITVEPGFDAANGDYDLNTRRLLQIIDAQRRRSNTIGSHLRIVAIEARPESDGSTGENASGDFSGEVAAVELIRTKKRAIIVPLENVATIPKVLQIGTEIAFVIPAYP